MMLKKGIQIAAKVMPNGQRGAGSAGRFVIPKIEVTNVRGYEIISAEISASLRHVVTTYHEEQVHDCQNLDVVSLVYRNIC